jgi:hypothetical protein
MRASNACRVLALVIASHLLGCAHNPAPKTWRPSAVQAQHITRGSWILVEPGASAGYSTDASPVEGELIAIDDSAYHVLTAGGLRLVSRSSTDRITLFAFGTSPGAIAAWASAGGLSTLSHGGFLILTAPMWAVAGVVAAAKESGAGVLHDAARARAFARFPQGLPPGFDPAALGPLVGGPAGGATVQRR